MKKVYRQRMLAKSRGKYGKPMYSGKIKSTKDCVSEISAVSMDAWNQILNEMREQLARISYETWIEPCKLISIMQDKIVLAVENEFSLAVLEKRYMILMEKVAEKVLYRPLKIELRVSDNL